MKNYLLIIALLYSTVSLAQTFEKTYELNSNLKISSAFEINDAFLISVNEYNNFDSGVKQSAIFKTNKFGDTIKSLYFNKYFKEGIVEMTPCYNNMIIVQSKRIKEENGNVYITYLQIDDNLEIILEKEFELNAKPDDLISIAHHLYPNKVLLSAIAVQSYEQTGYTYFIKYDSTGTIIENTITEIYHKSNYTNAILPMIDSSGYYYFIHQKPLVLNNDFVITDTIEFGASYISSYYYPKWYKNQIYFGSHNYKNSATINKYDSTFKKIKDYNLSNNEDIIHLQGVAKGMDEYNGSFFLACTYGFYNSIFSNYPNQLRLVSFNEDLKRNWEKYYGGDAYYILYYTLATSDGGCLLLSTRQDTTEIEQHVLHLLKVDSLGNYTPTGLKETTGTQNQVSLYPNPGTNQLTVELDKDYENNLFRLYTLTGQLVQSQQLYQASSQISTNHLQSGIYIYELIADDKIVGRGKWVKE